MVLRCVYIIACLCCILRGYFSTYTPTGASPSEFSTTLILLICVRLSISLSIGAYSISLDPSNEYLALHALPAKTALVQLYKSMDCTDDGLVLKLEAIYKELVK